MAAHVFARAARRMFTRLAMGIRDRYRFAAFKFRYNFARGQRYARRRQTALYGRRTCRIRRGIRRVFKRIAENSWMAFPAVLSAAVGGRTLFMTVAAVFQSVSPLSAAAVWSQIQTGLVGLVLQATLVPIIVMILSFAINNEKRVNND